MPVGVAVALLHLVRLALAGEHAPQGVEVGVEVVRVRERLERRAEEVALGVAGDAAERGVDAHEAPLGRDEGLADRRLVEGVAEALLGLAQLLRRLALGRDVARDRLQLDHGAAGVADVAPARLHPDPVAVLVAEAPLVLGRPVVEHRPQVRAHARLVVGMDDVERVVSDQLLGLVAEQRAAGGRDVRAVAPAGRCW